jgi:hypothetical protein
MMSSILERPLSIYRKLEENKSKWMEVKPEKSDFQIEDLPLLLLGKLDRKYPEL